MATIKDVAERSGISIKTVSRVINGAQTVRPNIRAKVEQAIRALNYVPALAARQLVTGRNFIIVLLVPDAAHWYYSRMVLAIAQACRSVGWHLVVEVFERAALEEDEGWSIGLSCNADAVIVLPPWADHPRMLQSLAALGLPAVRVAGRSPGYGAVLDVHDRAISRQMVEHLIAQGHERIAMIAPPNDRVSSEERHLGYRDAMMAAGHRVPDAFVIRSNMLFEGGVDAFRQLMSLPVRPTAIFAVNDSSALGAMTTALRLGYRVPRDIAFAGFDNSPESMSSYPSLSTVAQSFDTIGRNAVLMAIGRTSDEEGIQSEIILRESSLCSS
ncbi:LacI family DNA-binding transcriptional regulator [Novosphingobium rosa]|uniref:LacI family DNA-binding transcriptional regulator n=1 Tax=Novosphingobium rosa TaxID=76978 RepID=UPI000830DE8E|nr:LacI family DNA-binding transcriptional regulator [Novosphingobium rosa]